jgi:hypothetical protein
MARSRWNMTKLAKSLDGGAGLVLEALTTMMHGLLISLCLHPYRPSTLALFSQICTTNSHDCVS